MILILYFIYHYKCNVVFIIKDIDYFHIQGFVSYKDQRKDNKYKLLCSERPVIGPILNHIIQFTF
jgi:hypothetical protein